MTFYFHVHHQGRTITKSFGRTRDRPPRLLEWFAQYGVKP